MKQVCWVVEWWHAYYKCWYVASTHRTRSAAWKDMREKRAEWAGDKLRTVKYVPEGRR